MSRFLLALRIVLMRRRVWIVDFALFSSRTLKVARRRPGTVDFKTRSIRRWGALPCSSAFSDVSEDMLVEYIARSGLLS